MDRMLFEAARTGNTEHLHNLLKDYPLLLDTIALGGRENPLHIACIVGHTDFARELIRLKREFTEELNQDGLSPLHIVVKLLLRKQVTPRSAVEVNSSNERGLTPLDVLGLFQSEAGEREIEEMLREAGAMRARESQIASQESAIRVNVESRSRSPAKKLLDYFKYDTIKYSPGSVRNTLLVLAVLIATATYQAVLSPLGGVWQDDDSRTGINNGTPHVAGESIMVYHNPKSYRIFLICNSVGFFTSLHMINFLTNGFPMRTRAASFDYIPCFHL
ncbi:uncharacterized protein LOC129884070 [Solanum dulcamara]|uniref:uncharacterized protein LOC129884070 n=1 Tax=Solanum dulcamara TaxID=45834 RepID=UPI00248521FA|nr:uncharacterized protein LOC129884070 [Solanum dulcamara]